MASKQTKGRKKIEIKRIDDEEDRLVSFSKRRSGIYKKASELNTLCGTETAFIVFSPSGKPFSFGTPNLDTVLNRFMNMEKPGLPPPDSTARLIESHRRARIHELNEQYNSALDQLHAGKKQAQVRKRSAKPPNPAHAQEWWEVPVDEMAEQDVWRFSAEIEELSNRVNRCLMEKRMEADAAASTSFSGQQNFPIQQTGGGSLVGRVGGYLNIIAAPDLPGSSSSNI